jgi:dihydrofolate reductase
VASSIAALKQEDGPELQVHGSGNLIQTLLRHNLVDQYRLWVFPLAIGGRASACSPKAPSPPG